MSNHSSLMVCGQSLDPVFTLKKYSSVGMCKGNTQDQIVGMCKGNSQDQIVGINFYMRV